MNEKMLFVCHQKISKDGRKVGSLKTGECLPVAISQYSEIGFYPLLDESDTVEDFFYTLGFSVDRGVESQDETPSNGFWVYEVDYDEAIYDDDAYTWQHLQAGDLRRMTKEEHINLSQTGCPWSKGIIL